jgi:hypothetical protein
MNQFFDEIQIYECVAERTGNSVDRKSVRGRQGVCRSLSELTAKSKRLGDGFYYLAANEWPADKSKLDLSTNWQTMS